MSIIIGADFVPTESNSKLFINCDVSKLFDNTILGILQQADYSIFNLETPLADCETPIFKCGPNLIASTGSVATFKRIGVTLFTIANNHILDQGADGFKQTLQALNNAGIAYVGGGNSINEAKKPYIFNYGNKKIGIYACCEHEFSIANNKQCGANPYDPLETFDHIRDLKEKCDCVIVLYHGGKEHYRYPSPQLQKVCRKMIDSGASYVICQHSHCIGCEEKYNQGVIVYGQGNFLFDRSNSDFWKTGLLIELDELLGINYIPIVKDGYRVRAALEQEKEDIMKSFYERSERIIDPEFLLNEYTAFAISSIDNYLFDIGGRVNIVSRILNKLSNGRFNRLIIKLLYKKKKYVVALNFIECEAHRELLIEGLKNRCFK